MKTLIIAAVSGFLALQVISFVKPIVLGTFEQIAAAQQFAARHNH